MNTNLPSTPSFSQYLPHIDWSFLSTIGHILTIFVSIFTIFFLFLISYSIVRIKEIKDKEKKHLEHEIAHYAMHQADKSQKSEIEGNYRNPRWNKILGYVYSSNVADWKLAIIEADSMLEDLMDQLGFKGDNLGDKLKVADRETFPDLTTAWEVHTIRNRIAHESSDFELTAREAKRVVTLYEDMFREFGFI